MYMSGLIPYPRVSNDFEKNPTFELFPHPPLPIIENFNDESIKCWKNRRGNNINILLYFQSENYLVVLSDRGDFVLHTSFHDNDLQSHILFGITSCANGTINSYK